MANMEDLRYVRTERDIRSAFMKLVSGKSVGSVTVTALCREASISRNAFYLHHASIAELYATLVSELVDDVRAESLASAERRMANGEDDALSVAIIGALSRHEDLLRSLLPSDEGALAKCLAEGIEAAYVEAALRFGEHGGDADHRLRCAYAAWSLVGLVSRWIAETERPVDDVLALYEEISSSVVEASARYLMRDDAR
ncbi:MAG: TetR/AcrR family transcriptional regulator [Coriobacteriia bacterium]|nr:TetR/AcrR family transcriptional regulator [Coriobacteriia bacterium]